ncbi:MAG: tetratricopeptide repeat protein, partial [Candidatus Zixiibacteriota bacterium]
DRVVFERIGAVLIRANQRDVAKRVFLKTLNFDPENPFALFYLGRMEADSSRFDSARLYFDRLIAVDSTVPDGWTNLAFVYQQKKQLDSAEQVLELAARHVTSDRDNIQFFLAQILSQKEMPDSAIAVLKNAIVEGGDTVRALFQTGAEYEKIKNYDKASEAFELLLTINPQHHPTLNYFGYMLADRGERLTEALDMIERALKSEPESGAYLDSYAWVLYKLGRYQEALIQIQKAVSKTNNDPVVIEHLGDIEYALGNIQNARDAWNTALAFDPDNKSLKDKLSR